MRKTICILIVGLVGSLFTRIAHADDGKLQLFSYTFRDLSELCSKLGLPEKSLHVKRNNSGTMLFADYPHYHPVSTISISQEGYKVMPFAKWRDNDGAPVEVEWSKLVCPGAIEHARSNNTGKPTINTRLIISPPS